MKINRLATFVSLLGIAGAVSAQVVDRGLPDANLNNAAGANRSNVSWAYSYTNGGIEGDTFVMPTLGAGQHWVITGVRTWITDSSKAYDANGNVVGTAADTAPGGEFSNVSLFMGAPQSNLSVVSTGNFTGNLTTDNANVSVSQVTYNNLSEPNYQTTSGGYINIYQLDFTGLSIAASSGQTFAFGTYGTSAAATGNYLWFSHASNAALGGVTADGATGNIEEFDSSGNYVDTYSTLGNGWDKASDINVQVFAQAVPEPSELPLLAALITGGLATLKSRRRRA